MMLCVNNPCLGDAEKALTSINVDGCRCVYFYNCVSLFCVVLNFSPQEGELDESMRYALANDQVEFIRLFLENGLSLKTFLTVEELEGLYNHQVRLGIGGEGQTWGGGCLICMHYALVYNQLELICLFLESFYFTPLVPTCMLHGVEMSPSIAIQN